MDFKVTEPNLPDGKIIDWTEMERRSNIYISHFKAKSYREIALDKPAWCCLAFVADAHIGNEGVMYKQAREDAQLIGKSKHACGILGGDMIDNFIRTTLLEPLINQTNPPKLQIELLKEYIDFFSGNILLMISGNHDRWSKEVSGLDCLSTIAKEKKIIYSPDVFLFTLSNGKTKYTICIRHKYRYNSSLNQTHTVKQMWRLGDYGFDIGAVAHHHQPAIEELIMRGQQMIAIRIGSYKVADPFIRKVGFTTPKPVMPCVVISPDRKRMTPFSDLQEAIEYVEFKNRSKNGKPKRLQ